MLISVTINSKQKNQTALNNALEFIFQAIQANHEINSVFFYGYAVELLQDLKPESIEKWREISQHVPLNCCSTICEELDLDLPDVFQITGMGQWMEAETAADRRVEFV